MRSSPSQASDAGSNARTYERSKAAIFRKTHERFGGLSNMAAGFPLLVADCSIRTAEALYQACRFPHMPEVQKIILAEGSPMTAKMKSKPYRDQSREDWDRVRVKIMRWVLRVKLVQNFAKFSVQLLETGDLPIVEESRKDDFWGAKASAAEALVGANVLGRLLMELRDEVRAKRFDPSMPVPPPDISNFRLLGKSIGPIGGNDVRTPVVAELFGPDLAPASNNQMDVRQTTATTDGGTQSTITPPVDSSTIEEPRRHGEMTKRYPKRLIEVDLPIKRISAHARREKSIRHGHISTLHIWWARRPLGACRAVICAALWPDPVDVTQKDVDRARKEGKALELNTCPPAFRDAARAQMLAWTTHERQRLLGEESRERFELARKKPDIFDDAVQLRGALLDFIADFSNWDNAIVRAYLETSNALTQAAHEALGGAVGTRPLVVDPFAGGGSIPLEALRIGADSFASDLNPIPVLLNKVVLEYVPKYGQNLVSDVRKWGAWIKHEAEKELAEIYPKDSGGATPIAYLWARTILCEGPGCGVSVPILPSRLLEKGKATSVWLEFTGKSVVTVSIKEGRLPSDELTGTAKRGSVTCPCCAYTTPVARVREQLSSNGGGITKSRLLAVVTNDPKTNARSYRRPNDSDQRALDLAASHVRKLRKSDAGAFPDETLPLMSGVFNVPIYGHNTWSSLFSDRQLLLLVTLSRLVRQVAETLRAEKDIELSRAISTMLSIAVGKIADYSTTICTWVQSGGFVGHTFAQGQCLPMKFDYAESTPLSGFSGSWEGAIDWGCRILEREATAIWRQGHVEQASATEQPLPDDSASCLVTDPPYYNAVPYADLSDFFYVWHRRTLGAIHEELFRNEAAPKKEEICEMAGWDPDRYADKTAQFFESEIAKAFADSRRIVRPDGIGVIVFAHKSTSGWESLLQAIVQSGWIVTASWPVDTERASRLRAMQSAALGSSVHLICRPRENSDGSVRVDEVGDWRDVLQELPSRIHEWMPRLTEEGVVGADAIFACLGPALEIFSRYSRVEKASGDVVTLKEYLEHVWAAVSQEALSSIFAGASTEGFEPDARLTAMWLWTLSAPETDEVSGEDQESPKGDDEEAPSSSKKTKGGFVLEYDAARKIAQGLGAHLEDLAALVEVSGDKARLLPVSERTQHLFGKDHDQAPAAKKKKKSQLDLFSELTKADDIETTWGEKAVSKIGNTTLDRIHQSMILFAAGRGEALRRFLVDDGVGKDQRFWRLANALAALYPRNTDERRWVEGVLARKKGLGL